MIEVDISRVWNCFSLPDLLMMEREIFDAHMALPENLIRRADLPGEHMQQLLDCAERIRKDTEICVILGSGGGVAAAEAAIELLQGPNHNIGKGKGDPQLLFAGKSLSTRHRYELLRLMEGRSVSLIAVSEGDEDLAWEITFRGLREQLEKRWGREEADKRICLIARQEDPLMDAARQRGWACFETVWGGTAFGALSAAALLPMAVAGLDVPQILRGAVEAAERYDLRSFENPLWLYAAVRGLMYRQGRKTEVLAGFEPGMDAFGRWWQQLFAAAEGKSGKGIVPVRAEYPGDLRGLGQLLQGGACQVFETVMRFAPPDAAYILEENADDPEGLNSLAGLSLGHISEQTLQAAMDLHEEGGCGVISMDCGTLTPWKVGLLFGFMELAAALSAGIQGVNPLDGSGVRNCREVIRSRLGGC